MNLTKDSVSGIYPNIEPYNTGLLKVSELHTLYYEECGNPKGKPVIYVHGGPGAGSGPRDRRYFHPEKYRIILFDQRGCGKSTPHACLEDNTTWRLVEDMEKLRTHLGIKKWMVFGGSWGSTLSLAYAETHPESVTELILRGIFLLRKKEIDWFYQYGAHALFPDAWEHYQKPIPENERHDFLSAFHKRLTSSDRQTQLEAAKAWSIWEFSTAYLYPNADAITAAGEDQFALAFARIESHYFVNKGFFEKDDQLLKNIDRIRKIPGFIVQGRYDVVCPAMSAWDLHRAWPEADFVMIPDAGHSARENGISRALTQACDRFANHVSI